MSKTVVLAMMAYFLLILCSSLTRAQETLFVGNGSGFPSSHENSVEISLDNPENNFRALQMDIIDEDNYLSCTECIADPVRASDFDCFVQEQVGGECRVILFSDVTSENRKLTRHNHFYSCFFNRVQRYV